MARMGKASGMFALLKALVVLIPHYLFWGSLGLAIFTNNYSMIWLPVIAIPLGLLVRWLCRPLRYLIRAGHLAVVNEIIVTGKVPASPIKHGFDYVRANFMQAGVFFVLDRLLMVVIGGMKNMIIRTPVLRSTPFLGQVLKKSTKYIDECVMGYTMLTKRSHQPFRAAADGVVVYGVHFVPILKNSVKLVVVDWVLSFVIFLVALLIVVAGMTVSYGATFFAILIAVTVYQYKKQYMETKIFLSMYKCFLEGAAQTELPHPVQTTIMRMVPSFRQLCIGDLPPLEQQTILQQQDLYLRQESAAFNGPTQQNNLIQVRNGFNSQGHF